MADSHLLDIVGSILGFAAVSLAFGLVRSREVRARKSGDEYLLPFRVLQAVLTYRHA